MSKNVPNPAHQSLRILLTGATGYVGGAIGQRLEDLGHTVVGLSRTPAPSGESAPVPGGPDSPEARRSNFRPAEQVFCDLADALATRQALAAIAPCQIVIHSASRTDSGAGVIAGNVAMARHLLAATQAWSARWIYLSSVAVYGEAGRTQAIAPADALRPATDYGRSKQACEEFLGESGLNDLRLLRITPVYSADALRNKQVRVYLPGTPLRLKIWPEPRHSLCDLSTLVERVVWHVHDARLAKYIENVADFVPHRQNQLASEAQKGPILYVPEFFLRPLYFALACVPGRFAYHLRCVYWKLFRSNVYEIPEATD